MAYLNPDRYSRFLLPQSVEEYVNAKDPVRVYDAFIEKLDLEDLGIELNPNLVGAPPYDPLSMLKLLVFGYSYGIRSSRKLERACHHNLSFIWLMGNLKPSFKTIANFRRKNLEALTKILTQCARLCMKLGLIDGNVLFVDGSKMRANASLNQIWTEERCTNFLKKLDDKIKALLDACEETDSKEEGQCSLVELKEELQENEALREKVESILKELKEENLSSVNSTDRDSVKTKGRQGIHSGYNAQVVTDGKEGLIVSNDVVSSSTDYGQFTEQIQKAEEVIGKKADAACADNGYNQLSDLEEIASREETMVVVPNKKQAGHKKKEAGAFDKENFLYDEDKDEYVCPEGKRLKYKRSKKEDGSREYRMTPYTVCTNCKHYGVCTTAKRGRTIHRLEKEKLREKLDEIYQSEQGQKVYAQRKEKSELPFGHIKRNLGAGYFLLRGREAVNAEMSILSTNFNISRIMTLCGVPKFLTYLRTGVLKDAAPCVVAQ